jgi:hypothetical protein
MTGTTNAAPLSRLDEYPIHQNPEPLRIVGTSDASAHERYWCTAQHPASDVLIVTALDFYPTWERRTPMRFWFTTIRTPPHGPTG